ncbi:MAG TPA: DUF72 domain-containing protein [Acidobacteriota bacterium]|nr:DUF72 domain-containing protein [Acidobacteriota bacterium]
MQILAGTSGFSYKAWKGNFYPADLPDTRMLEFYAGQLPSVEINNTFYRMPSAKTVSRWQQVVPDEFRFVLKATRRISHFSRLRADDELLEYLFGVTAELGSRLGAHLVQMPPYAKKDIEALRAFLQRVAKGDRVAFEFRNESWFDADVYEALREFDSALVIADGGKVEVPLVATASWGYLRLRRDGYDAAALDEWRDRIRDMPWTEAFVFFKHEDDGAGPRMARAMLGLDA